MAKVEMSKKERNEAILRKLVEGAKRADVIEEFGITQEKLDRIVVKAGQKAQRQMDEMAAALKLEAPVKRNGVGSPTRKAVPAKPSRLNPEVTERLKVQVIKEGRIVKDLTDRTEAARKRRNDTIRKLCDRGLSEREIGSMVGMSGPRINQIYFGTNGSKS